MSEINEKYKIKMKSENKILKKQNISTKKLLFNLNFMVLIESIP